MTAFNRTRTHVTATKVGIPDSNDVHTPQKTGTAAQHDKRLQACRAWLLHMYGAALHPPQGHAISISEHFAHEMLYSSMDR